MILLALNEQNMFIYPAHEKGLRYGFRDFLIPEVLHVLRFEVGEYLVAGVVVLKLLRDRGRPLGADPRQHYGQGMGRYLQELLHSPGFHTRATAWIATLTDAPRHSHGFLLRTLLNFQNEHIAPYFSLCPGAEALRLTAEGPPA